MLILGPSQNATLYKDVTVFITPKVGLKVLPVACTDRTICEMASVHIHRNDKSAKIFIQ